MNSTRPEEAINPGTAGAWAAEVSTTGEPSPTPGPVAQSQPVRRTVRLDAEYLHDSRKPAPAPQETEDEEQLIVLPRRRSFGMLRLLHRLVRR